MNGREEWETKGGRNGFTVSHESRKQIHESGKKSEKQALKSLSLADYESRGLLALHSPRNPVKEQVWSAVLASRSSLD